METAQPSEQFIGIDASITRTAVCNGGDKFDGVSIFGNDHAAWDVTARIVRYDRLAREIVGHIDKLNAACPVRLVALEAYSLGSANSAAMICEFGVLLRLRLTQRYRLVEVPPAKLKQFITGKGNANKPVFVTTVAKKYNTDFKGEDEHFAFGLWLMARAAIRPDTGTKPQSEIAAAILNPQPKEKKQSKRW